MRPFSSKLALGLSLAMAMGICRKSVWVVGQVAVEKKLRYQLSSSVRVVGFRISAFSQTRDHEKGGRWTRVRRLGDETASCIVISGSPCSGLEEE
jgi:hypothetical protein